jgi:phosphoribosyl 1,2-cyclic phosphate phosphodiesterase
MNKITILGTGTSTGVPILGCKCGVCQSNDPRNQRLRTSVLLETANKKNILIDTSPDLRTQLLHTHTSSIDAVILTHDHADHTHGIDDLRPLSYLRPDPIIIYTDQYTVESVTNKFPYIFKPHNPVIGGGIPRLNLKVIDEGPTQIENENFNFWTLPHGHGSTLSVIHEKLGYIVDCREIPDNILTKFRDAKLELLIIDCLRYEPHQTHLHLDLALEYIQQIAPTSAILTHMAHEIDYLDLMNQLQRRGIKNVFPGIDGQSFLYS